MLKQPRDYTNATKYESSPAQKHNRALRNKARREMERDGKAKKGDGKDVGHKKPLDKGGSNRPSNWAMQTETSNRSWRKGRKGYDVPRS